MNVVIDHKSGFCFGVVSAIKKAEDALLSDGKLYCLGDIVHNGMEVNRLEKLGLIIIDHETYRTLSDCRVLVRTHGEPPSTYEYARANNIELIDATCPVVLKLQQRVKKAAEEMEKAGGQVIIYGKQGHAEVNGLIGQTSNRAIIVEEPGDLETIDPEKPAVLFAQTTKSIEKFQQLKSNIQEYSRNSELKVHDTICRQVANRVPRMKEFAAQHDVIVFVGGQKSSNARILYDVCLQTNPRSYFISSPEELDFGWFENAGSVGICGATSTPQWLMEQIRELLVNH
ncbi:MAG: 4-hydroxy-3-methylbut-2-enyl diphosphate reductase [Bacteroidetes bacterium GWF2_42_66]|nr:MAG: 4-hydroxy-3-methylbut-2-enyl diphosphate reductase [Bacteroidetes bacterium GWA2_42_15]OFX99409.1 MAG: 4-hydroxy-3-methylbut-2-enyl diphosphate reductase [Bacteroidetes bacterium GWE2_42_39]OFY40461.1 MAG: 4-hydroxy-3-methylbut-2-enyl diphosphate reductase [Bacteroidetes bacterium GWF2_42_66]HBL76917.1 4-hydroxy-3-methylbut-2-enyl diphosphate reductase [Prolixibacteraceae bacterium]HCR92325.1 4-hydroxy-3-methylbut-2-enyl diphosphate reductase [Prolixibacteraceae bacterium]